MRSAAIAFAVGLAFFLEVLLKLENESLAQRSGEKLKQKQTYWLKGIKYGLKLTFGSPSSITRRHKEIVVVLATAARFACWIALSGSQCTVGRLVGIVRSFGWQVEKLALMKHNTTLPEKVRPRLMSSRA